MMKSVLALFQNAELAIFEEACILKRYKDCWLKTMIHRAYALSSTTEAFNQKCTELRSIFTRLDKMLFIKQRNPCLNTQIESIRAKLFV